MNLEEKIAQMCLVGINSKADIDAVKNLVKNNKIGGVILYKNNYDNYLEMTQLINDLKESNKNNLYPLLIAIDQEGGRVNRMPKEFNNIYSASKLASANDVDIIKTAADITGTMLYKTGINMDFAPVLDLKKFADEHAIGNRAFGSDANEVSNMGSIYYKTLASKMIIPVVKHFPGHGACKFDSHKFLPIIYNYDDSANSHLLPFKQAISDNIDAIMVGHILIKGYTSGYPASISPNFIKNELRQKFAYQNIVISDELSMKSISLIYGRRRSIKLAFLAGNDIICNKYFKNFTTYSIDHIVRLVKSGKLLEKNIDESIERIISLKQKYQLDKQVLNENLNIEKINEKIINLNKYVDKSL